jgi:hypothetical protein
MSETNREVSGDTYQESTAPVQAFTSPAIPMAAGIPLEARRGRPPRISAEQRADMNRMEASASQIDAVVEGSVGSVRPITNSGVSPTELGSAYCGLARGAALGAAIGSLIGGPAAALGAQIGAVIGGQTEEAKKPS